MPAFLFVIASPADVMWTPSAAFVTYIGLFFLTADEAVWNRPADGAVYVLEAYLRLPVEVWNHRINLPAEKIPVSGVFIRFLQVEMPPPREVVSVPFFVEFGKLRPQKVLIPLVRNKKVSPVPPAASFFFFVKVHIVHCFLQNGCQSGFFGMQPFLFFLRLASSAVLYSFSSSSRCCALHALTSSHSRYATNLAFSSFLSRLAAL